eukprot:gene31291-6438_t
MSHSEENGPLRRHTGFWQAFKTWYRIQITVGGDRPAHWITIGGDRPAISMVLAWFWQAFNTWYRTQITAGGDRPVISKEALLHANGLRSAEEEALLHANGLRSAEEVKKYNRSYKSKKTMLQTAAFVKSKQIQQSSTSEHTMDRASITSGVVGDIEGLTMFQTAASHKSKQIQQSSTSEHTVDRASITSGMVGDIEGLASLIAFNMTNLPPFVLPTVTSGDRCKPYRADSFNSADDSESLPSSSQQLPESFGLGQQASATHYGLASQQPSSSQQLPEYFGLGQRASASHYGSASQQPSSSQQLPEPFGLGRRASAFFYGLASLEPETLAQRPSALTCNSSLPATISGVASYHLDTCGLDLPGGALTCNGFLPATISGVASHQLDTYGLDPPGGAITYNSSLPASSYGGMPPQLDTSGHVQRSSASQYNLVPPTSLLLSPFTNSHKVSFRMIPCMPAQPVASTSWYPPLRVGPPLRVVSIIESGASQTDEPCTSWKRSFSDQLSNAQNKRSRRESTTSVFGPESLSSVVKGPNQRTSYVITTSLSSVHAASVPSSSFSLDDYVL